MNLFFEFIVLLFASVIIVQSLKLEQVIILSRHNVRTPLSKYLSEITPNEWPKWKEKSGYLTAKGFKLEGFMGEYFSMWFKKESLISSCPTEDDFFAYANIKQRTRESALAFVLKSFPGCNVTVHYLNTTVDPIFNPVIHNDSDIFKNLVIEQMSEHLKNLNLNNSYDYLENVLDYKNSSLCLKEQKCDLKTGPNKIVDVQKGYKPNLSGPLKLSNSAIDAFVMENYEGFQAAWGMLDNEKQWLTTMKLSREFHNTIFNMSLLATDIAHPLLKYISEICLNTNRKITLLMGHDANIFTILKALNFKPYSLKYQYELTPVGGKILFEKWYEPESGRHLLRVDYVYQSTEQLRKAIELSLHDPPMFQLLELQDCPFVKDGFCLWDDFVKLLELQVSRKQGRAIGSLGILKYV